MEEKAQNESKDWHAIIETLTVCGISSTGKPTTMTCCDL